jgi:hypothetical protein
VKKFLEFIVKNIIDKDQNVEINESENEFGEQVFAIKVDATQAGQVIGRNGNIIQSIRALAKIIAVKENLRVRINVEG